MRPGFRPSFVVMPRLVEALVSIVREEIWGVFRVTDRVGQMVVVRRDARFYVGRLNRNGDPVFFCGPFVDAAEAIDVIPALSASGLSHAA